MRIALIDPSLFTVPYDRALAGGLEAAGHQVVLHGRRPGPDDPDAGGLHLVESFYRFTSSRAVARLPRRIQLGIKGIDHVASMRGLLRRMQRDPPDIVHFQWLPLPSLDQLLLRGFARLAPLILTVHDTAPSNGDPAAAVRQRGFFDSLSLFDTLIVHTEQGQARLLARGIDARRVALLSHGPLQAGTSAADADPMRGELTFLLFGKIKPYKGTDHLIEAFARLPAALQAQARIRVVGKPYMPIAALQSLADRHGIADRCSIEARFVDDDEIPGLFGPGVVAAFPYREIEASGVLSLALVHGRPVIASSIGSFSEMITHGREGLLVPVSDVGALAAAMRRMIEDRGFAARCARASRRLVATLPGWDEIGRQTVGLYDDALACAERRGGAA